MEVEQEIVEIFAEAKEQESITADEAKNIMIKRYRMELALERKLKELEGMDEP